MSKHSSGREEKANNEYYIKGSSKSKKIKKVLLTIFVVFLMILAILAGIATWFIQNKLGKIQKENIDENEIGISEQIQEELSDYRNIALLGIDSRADDYGLGNRSDCIIIASINQKTKEVRLISVYRDTYMQVEENGYARLDKVTHAYSYGGAQNALKALNTNLDLNITEYITVNFDAVEYAVCIWNGSAWQELYHYDANTTTAGTQMSYDITSDVAGEKKPEIVPV